MNGVQDFYRVLKIQRTASTNEIKEAYRKLAFSLHPDRHDGCQIKTNQFKEATEAYQHLSDQSKRIAHDRTLDGYVNNNNGNRRRPGSPPPPNYRKVYAQRPPPPGFKTFDAKYHYDMHYGDGMMKEEIDRARKRAEAASGRLNHNFGYEYVSPLGKGFEFAGSGGNPFSRSGRRRMNNKNKSVGDVGSNSDDEFEYEEAYMDLGNKGSFSASKVDYKVDGRQIISERMKERRKFRRRNRGDPLRYSADDDSAACVIM